MKLEEQRQLGADMSTVLDRYHVHGPDRLGVLLAVLWAEAQKLGFGPQKLAKHAIQAWSAHAKKDGGLFG